MLLIVDKLLAATSSIVQAITFDAHQSHTLFRQALFGQVSEADGQQMQEMDLQFFSRVSYKELPAHALPRLPAKVCIADGKAVWPIQGACVLVLE